MRPMRWCTHMQICHIPRLHLPQPSYVCVCVCVCVHVCVCVCVSHTFSWKAVSAVFSRCTRAMTRSMVSLP